MIIWKEQNRKITKRHYGKNVLVKVAGHLTPSVGTINSFGGIILGDYVYEKCEDTGHNFVSWIGDRGRKITHYSIINNLKSN